MPESTEVEVKEPSFADIEPVFTNGYYSIYSFPNKHSQDTSTDVIVFPHTVMIKNVTRTEGINKHSKALYVNWVSDSARIFSLKRERYGATQLRVYKSQKKKKNRPAMFSDVSKSATLGMGHLGNSQFSKATETAFLEKAVYGGKDIISPAYRAQAFLAWKVVQMFKERNPNIDVTQFPVEYIYMYLAYPALRMFAGENKLERVESAVRTNTKIWLLEPTSRMFIRKAFGKEAVRKDFIKAAASSKNAAALNLCHELKKIVPVDWLVMLLKDSESNYLSAARTAHHDGNPDVKSLRRLFTYASLPQRKRLLFEKIPAKQSCNPYLYRDTIRLFESITDEYAVERRNDIDFTSWDTLHDSLAVVQREFTMIPAAVPVTPIAEALDGATYVYENESYTVKAPKINHELIKWGSELNNCIAGYESAVMRQETDVFAVYTHDEKLYANLEVRQGQLVQFVQKHNMRVPEEMTTKMIDIIEKVRKEKSKAKLIAA